MGSYLTIVDAVVITFTFLSTILAMARGITREILGVASFMGAAFLSVYFADSFAPLLLQTVNLEPIANKFSADINVIAGWLSGGFLFIILWIVFTVITAQLSKAISNSAVSGIDSALGFTFGVVRGLFIVGIIYTMYTHFIPPEKYHKPVIHAQLKPILDQTSEVIINLADLVLPERISNGFNTKPAIDYTAPSQAFPNESPLSPEAILKEKSN